jgi:hypothetical protein
MAIDSASITKEVGLSRLPHALQANGKKRKRKRESSSMLDLLKEVLYPHGFKKLSWKQQSRPHHSHIHVHSTPCGFAAPKHCSSIMIRSHTILWCNEGGKPIMKSIDITCQGPFGMGRDSSLSYGLCLGTFIRRQISQNLTYFIRTKTPCSSLPSSIETQQYPKPARSPLFAFNDIKEVLEMYSQRAARSSCSSPADTA